MPIKKPIFLFGVPRSGTSVIHEAFSKHEDLGWVSNYQNRLVGLPIVSLANRFFDNALVYKMGSRKMSNKMNSLKLTYPKPAEPYILWDKLTGVDFSYEFLLGDQATDTSKNALQKFHTKILKLQGKSRLTNKFTGPPRIEYIHSVFPDAYFIHIVRDPKAVTCSLMHVDFWKQGGGYEKIWWKNGQPSESLLAWKSKLSEPYINTAYQCRNIIEKASIEGKKVLNPNQFLEIRYEDFLKDPKSTIAKMYDFVGLAKSERGVQHLELPSKNPNDKYLKFFNKEELNTLNKLFNDVLVQYKYTT
ncbi:MAG: sulfotransferase [Bacteroidota bacterium]